MAVAVLARCAVYRESAECAGAELWIAPTVAPEESHAPPPTALVPSVSHDTNFQGFRRPSGIFEEIGIPSTRSTGLNPAPILNGDPVCRFPVTPLAPVAPLGPVGPISPGGGGGGFGPGSPCGPVALVAPVAPYGPVGPATPCGPCFPSGPGRRFAFFRLRSGCPVTPVTPVTLLAPCDRSLRSRRRTFSAQFGQGVVLRASPLRG